MTSLQRSTRSLHAIQSTCQQVRHSSFSTFPSVESVPPSSHVHLESHSAQLTCWAHAVRDVRDTYRQYSRTLCSILSVRRPPKSLLWPPCVAAADILFYPCGFFFMAALCNRGPLYFCPVISIYRLSSIYLFSSPNLSGRRLDVYHTLTHGVTLVRI